MRVADKTAFEQVRTNLSKNRSKMSELQNQAATQKRVTKPSDDPLGAARVLGSRVELVGTDQYMKNLNTAKSFLEYSDQSLEELTELLVRAKELVLSQANDASANSQSRRVVAEEVGQLYNQVVNIGNRKLGDRFIFGGYKTTEPPFDIRGKYSGDSGEILIQIDKNSFVAMNMPGQRVFKGMGIKGDAISQVMSQQATSVEQFLEQKKIEESYRTNQPPEQQPPSDNIELRQPASDNFVKPRGQSEQDGIDLFNTVAKLRVAMMTNDKFSIQDAIDHVDQAIEQVVLSRAQIGAKGMVLNTALETLQKQKVDNNQTISQLEDADAFEVVSEINKTDGTLKASLETSGKLMPPSLLDFLA